MHRPTVQLLLMLKQVSLLEEMEPLNTIVLNNVKQSKAAALLQYHPPPLCFVSHCDFVNKHVPEHNTAASQQLIMMMPPPTSYTIFGSETCETFVPLRDITFCKISDTSPSSAVDGGCGGGEEMNK